MIMKELQEKDLKYIWHPCSQMKDYENFSPIVIAKGEGVFLEDVKGKKYLDAVSSWWVNLFGHSNKRINEALYKQANTLEHTIFTNFSHKPAIELCERIINISPNRLNKVFFGDDGSSAVEIALKLSFQHHQQTGKKKKTKFVKLSDAYHGESIVDAKNLEKAVRLLIKRARTHSKGKADFINIKIEELNKSSVREIDALVVTNIETIDSTQSMECIKNLLIKIGIDNKISIKILDIFNSIENMRGVILLDINTLKRLEPDKNRGIRVTYMDFKNSNISYLNKSSKLNTHFIEALALASKVINCPNIIGEICVSDDPNYTAGYIATKKYGYVRFNHMKKLGDERGGRIFLYDSSINKELTLEDNINYLEKEKVIIRDNIKISKDISYEDVLLYW